MNVRNICLQSDGIELAAELYVPPAHEPCPALCICHGVPANTYNPADRGYAGLAQTFCHAGFVTLIFNFRGAGKSQGNIDMLGWTRDLQVALNFLCNLDEIDRKRICLLGFSGGAAVSVYITAHDPRVSLLLACACPAHFRFVTNKEAAISTIRHFQEIDVIRDKDFPPSVEEWVKGFEEVSAIDWIDRISPRPLLLVHGDADEVVPLEHAYMLFQKAKEPKEIAIIPGAKHKLRLEEKAMTTVLDWLKARC